MRDRVTGIRKRALDVPVWKTAGGGMRRARDLVAVEEPLEIRLAHAAGCGPQLIAVTMRTPGDDVELALGYLHAEGVVRSFSDVENVRHAGPSGNVIAVTLRPEVEVDPLRLERHSFTSSSCGACGKTSLEALDFARPPVIATSNNRLDPEAVKRLPESLLAAQAVFRRTGGLHAAGLASEHGRLLETREDIGRHNAVDKLVGSALMAGTLPLDGRILVVSGRASFELVQKALMAGLPVLAAVGAPSSLAVEIARRHGLTLFGFVRRDRFNVYTHPGRVRGVPRPPNGNWHEAQNSQ